MIKLHVEEIQQTNSELYYLSAGGLSIFLLPQILARN
jgi:hypothetical protein